MPTIDLQSLDALYGGLTCKLLAARAPTGGWLGRLSDSALATATAVAALAALDRSRYAPVIAEGRDWLAAHVNADGGWGDTPRARSNLSTTLIVVSALRVTDKDAVMGQLCGCAVDERPAKAGTTNGAPRVCSTAFRRPHHVTDPLLDAIENCQTAGEAWLLRAAGGADSAALSAAVTKRYGGDRTFAAPIMSLADWCGTLDGDLRWLGPQLPFALAALPQKLFRWLRLPVVSYALPALIAVGLYQWRRRGGGGVQAAAVSAVLRRLERIQPASGGYLEAVPLTAFVVLCLAASGFGGQAAARRGAEFLINTRRANGAWPIDVDLSSWVTTLAVQGLWGAGGVASNLESDRARAEVCDALLARQWKVRHPFTGAAAGGWGWTDRDGAVPDADDTAGALLALYALNDEHFSIPDSVPELHKCSGASLKMIWRFILEGGRPRPPGSRRRRPVALHQNQENVLNHFPLRADSDYLRSQAVWRGVKWLLDLQNRDGGWPTFCRGWGRWPFDRSCPDLTAHALRALSVWRSALPAAFAGRLKRAQRRGLSYLKRSQGADGSWIPLWFGCETAPEAGNPTYGTSRVLLGLRALADEAPETAGMLAAGEGWLCAAQAQDGGWVGAAGCAPTLEETAWAVEALAESSDATALEAVRRGIAWIENATAGGERLPLPATIGYYFSSLWYEEESYPMVFAAAALRRARRAAAKAAGMA